MATYTRDQLVNEAASNLSLISSGNPLENEDALLIRNKAPALLDQLAADGIVEIDNIEEIPGEYFNALGELLANECATKFGVPYSEEKKMLFERRLRVTAAASPTYEVLRVNYF